MRNYGLFLYKYIRYIDIYNMFKIVYKKPNEDGCISTLYGSEGIKIMIPMMKEEDYVKMQKDIMNYAADKVKKKGVVEVFYNIHDYMEYIKDHNVHKCSVEKTNIYICMFDYCYFLSDMETGSVHNLILCYGGRLFFENIQEDTSIDNMFRIIDSDYCSAPRCPVCFEHYEKNPEMGRVACPKCPFIVCNKCINKMNNNGEFRCPQCRTISIRVKL